MLIGANLVFSAIDLTAQLFFNYLQRINPSRGARSWHATVLIRTIRNIFTQPGRYEQIVASINPGAADHSPTATRLDSAHALDFSQIREPEDVTEDMAAAYLWQTLRVPLSVAREVLQP